MREEQVLMKILRHTKFETPIWNANEDKLAVYISVYNLGREIGRYIWTLQNTKGFQAIGRYMRLYQVTKGGYKYRQQREGF